MRRRTTLLRIAEEHLFDLGPRGVGLLADHGDVHRHLTPAVKIETRADDFRFDDRAGALLRGEVIAREKYLADENRARFHLVARAAHDLAEEILRRVEQDARAVAGLAVRVHGAAMPQRLQRADRHGDDLAARLAVDGDHEAHAARIALIAAIVGVGGFQLRAFALVAGDVFVSAHVLTPPRRPQRPRVP
ncbi:MAG: Uncharacterized protein FD124_2983 [Alphaproteobacteria bacterium]|nr:MAG: Uncharacterized protein FD124_2983 [Alphaproteobacteria bacterium]